MAVAWRGGKLGKFLHSFLKYFSFFCARFFFRYELSNNSWLYSHKKLWLTPLSLWEINMDNYFQNQGIITSILLYLPTALPTHQDWVVNPRSIRLLWDKIKIIPQPELPKTTQWDPGVWWRISLGGICTGAERKQSPMRHILQLFLQFFILYQNQNILHY